ncbi:zinc-dependent alcohol dehydrogenase family protein [Streptomyces galbus]|uniref:NAD(P)-dependent alcohol dehydrogenase n=1 Tax=Streptomyces galbus TaxID=33898 RepID=A0A4U5WZE3_STRGB|nr:NAD(P)-dependent alcohol dehydrogenase [Streptomyces galbus]TKT08014.1 NAD(P)-dependent alcohol dehydrogenase [Streptomyces galbus]GHD42254.1 alcohol dehydrogenase [Streptomyces galbus]
MKAVAINKPGTPAPFSIVELPDPGKPGPGEVRVRIHATTINYNDVLVIRNPNTLAGHIPLADGAGVVEEVGEGVTDLAVGDTVFGRFFPQWLEGGPTTDNFHATPGMGLPGYAREIAVAPATQFERAPKGYTHAEAATLTVAGLTAWRALFSDGGIKPGDKVLILGTGGVAVFALQFAKLAGATTIVTSSSDAKLERVRQLGADHLVNYRTEPQWGDHVQRLTNGGVDLVLEVGGPATLPQSIRAARIGGLVSLIGVLTGTLGEIPTGELNMKQVRVHGLVVGGQRQQRDMVRALDEATLRPVIDRTFRLDDLNDALEYFGSGAHLGKVVIEL